MGWGGEGDGLEGLPCLFRPCFDVDAGRGLALALALALCAGGDDGVDGHGDVTGWVTEDGGGQERAISRRLGVKGEGEEDERE